MTFYLIYTGVIFLLALIGTKAPVIIFSIRNKQYKVEIIWGIMILSSIIVLGLRDVQTYDTLAYSRGFDLMKSGDYQSSYFSYNILYILINQLAIAIGGNVHMVYFICACLSIFFLVLGLEQVECNKYLFLVLYMLTFQFFDQFNIIRQGVAMSISFFAFNAFLLKTRNFKFYFIFIVIAALFHLSVIVMLPIYFISTKKILYPVMVLSVAGVYLFSGLLSRIPFITYIFGSIWSESYVTSFDYALITLSEVFIALAIIAFRKKIAIDEKDNVILNLVFFFPLFRMGAAQFFILHRLSKYFINYYIFALLMIPRLEKRGHDYIIYMFIFIFYFLWFFFYMMGYESFHPYKMISFKALFEY